MDHDEDEITFETLRQRFRKSDRSVAARRMKETKPMPYPERRKSMQVRTEPTYFKFSPEFKKRLIAHSLSLGVPMVEVLERALDAMERGNTQ